MRTLRSVLTLVLTGLLLLGVAGFAAAGGNGETAQADGADEEQPAGEMPEAGDEGEMTEAGAYVQFSEVRFREAADKKRVYFFHAGWCPTCRAANKAFEDNLERIPSDVVLFKTDYDTSGELKRRYAVTYQHTFVLVDANGNQVRKWSGGDIDELVENTKGSL